jgi:hypothetical protein
MGQAVADGVQKIEIAQSAITAVSLMPTSHRAVSQLAVGSTLSYDFLATTSLESYIAKALLVDGVTWSTSDSDIATVDAYGTVTGKGIGSVTITATDVNGYTASAELTVSCSNHQWDQGTVTTAPTATTAGVKTYQCILCGETKTETIAATGTVTTPSTTTSGSSTTTEETTAPVVNKPGKTTATATSNTVKITWKKVAGASGYQVQISKKSNFKNAKKITLSKSKKSYKAKKLKKHTKYYVRVRAYTLYRDEQGNQQKSYSGWTKITKTTK